jgi:hypothetical protein
MLRNSTAMIQRLQYENHILTNNYNLLVERMNLLMAENERLKQEYLLIQTKRVRHRKKNIVPPSSPSNTLYYISQPAELSENPDEETASYSSITMSE